MAPKSPRHNPRPIPARLWCACMCFLLLHDRDSASMPCSPRDLLSDLVLEWFPPLATAVTCPASSSLSLSASGRAGEWVESIAVWGAAHTPCRGAEKRSRAICCNTQLVRPAGLGKGRWTTRLIRLSGNVTTDLIRYHSDTSRRQDFGNRNHSLVTGSGRA